MPGCISLNGDPGCRKDLKGCGDVGSRRIEKSGMNRPKECPAYIRVVSPDISLKYIELVRLTVEFVNTHNAITGLHLYVLNQKGYSMLSTGITYKELLARFKKGQRNGNWRKLRFLDKALYRASLWYAKRSGNIVNGTLVEKLLALVDLLKETKGMRIFKRGFKKAVVMLEKGEETNLFVWAPSLRYWLSDPDYIFWLGTVW